MVATDTGTPFSVSWPVMVNNVLTLTVEGAAMVMVDPVTGGTYGVTVTLIGG